jgi:predicted NAD-dependent protein-ADP-ribosyltransferase YbiA (DUF1768 family)
MEFFYSKSKLDSSLGSDIPKNWKQYLSNFTNYDNSNYPSVEAKFQAMKFCFSNKPDHRHQIDWKNITAEQAKLFGSKGYFNKYKIQLDVQKWNKNSFLIMKVLIEHRFRNDLLFQKILKRIREKNIQLIHYSLRDKYWGAYKCKKTNLIIGKNKLGYIYNHLQIK